MSFGTARTLGCIQLCMRKGCCNGRLTVRIGPDAHRSLRELSEQLGEPVPAVLALAIEEYRRKWLLHGLNEDFAALRADPQAWREEEEEERAVWDATLADGLAPE